MIENFIRNVWDAILTWGHENIDMKVLSGVILTLFILWVFYMIITDDK